MAKNTKYEEDLDRTDELPQLNLAAYEAASRGDDETLSRTDSWATLGQAQLQAARISQLEADLQERDSALDVLRGNLEKTASSESQLASELNGILEKIAQLETRLSEAESLNNALTERSSAADDAKAAADARATAVELSKQQLLQQQTEIEATHREAESRLQHEIAALQTQIAEQERRRQEELDDASSKQLTLRQRLDAEITAVSEHSRRMTALQESLDAERARSQTLQGSIVDLEGRIEKQVAATQALARNFASQLSQLEEANQLLGLRDNRIQQLENALRQTTEQSHFFEDSAEDADERARSLQEQLTASKQQVSNKEQENQSLNQRNVELRAQLDHKIQELQSLAAANAELNQSLDAERSALHDARAELSHQQGAYAQLRQQLETQSSRAETLEGELKASNAAFAQRDARVQSLDNMLQELRQAHEALGHERDALQQRAVALEIESKEREQSIQTQTQEIEEWQRVWREMTPRVSANETLIGEQVKQLASLDSELQNALRECREQKAVVSQAREQVVSLMEHLAAKDRRIASLEVELGAHIKALGAIGRGIKRAGAENTAESQGTRVRSLVAVDDEQIVHLLNRSTMTIGRAPDNDIQIDSKKISRKHACLRVAPNAVIIEDLSSTNGLFVNGRRTKKQLLHDGDEILIGEVRFKLSSRLSARMQ